MKMKIKKYLHISVDSSLENPNFTFFDCNMEGYGYIQVGEEQEITIEVPDNFNPIPKQIEALKNEQTRIQAEAQVKVMALNEKIIKLLFIEAPKEKEIENV